MAAIGKAEIRCNRCGSTNISITVEQEPVDVTPIYDTRYVYVCPASTLVIKCHQCGYEVTAVRQNDIGPKPEEYKPTLPPEGGKVVEVGHFIDVDTEEEEEDDEPDHPDEYW